VVYRKLGITSRADGTVSASSGDRPFCGWTSLADALAWAVSPGQAAGEERRAD
jgi:hypothetical protein